MIFGGSHYLIGGHYGSGKTEIAVNLALLLRARGQSVVLVDLDIVNPYFRSFEKSDLLEAAGVRLISSSLGGLADVPALPGEVQSAFAAAGETAVFDLGGDPAGAKVLARYREELGRIDFTFWYVLNANRPETNTLAGALGQLRQIEAAGGQPVGAIVNNTHLLHETTADDVRRGDALARRLSAETGIPYMLSACEARLVPELGDLGIPLLPLTLRMLRPWEQ